MMSQKIEIIQPLKSMSLLFLKKKILGILTYTQGEKGKGFKEKLKRLHFHLLGRLNYKVIIIVSY